MNDDQKFLAEAYNTILSKEAEDASWETEEFFKVLSKLEPGKIYSYKGQDMAPEFNHWMFTSEEGMKNASLKRVGAQGARVLTDYQGKQQAGLNTVTDLVPSTMTPEEYRDRDRTTQRYITQSVQSQKYSD